MFNTTYEIVTLVKFENEMARKRKKEKRRGKERSEGEKGMRGKGSTKDSKMMNKLILKKGWKCIDLFLSYRYFTILLSRLIRLYENKDELWFSGNGT